MKSSLFTLSALLVSALPVLAGTSTPSTEEPLAVAPEAAPWNCRLSLYGWAQQIDGDTGVLGFTTPVDIDFQDILDNLDFAVMGAVEVGYGRWSFIADSVYADLSNSRSGPLGGTVHVGLDEYLGNFLVAYEAVKTDSLMLSLYGGARVNYLGVDISYRGPAGGSFGISDNKTWVDPVVGGRFQVEMPNNFFFRALGDVGGFGVSSEFTWQALAAFGYNFTEHSTILLGYRAIGTDFTDGGFTYDVTTHGLILGYQYTF